MRTINFWFTLSYAERSAVTLLSVALAATASALNRLVDLPQVVFMALTGLTLLLVISTAHIAIAHALSRATPWLTRVMTFIAIALTAAATLKVSGLGFSRDDEIYSWNMWALQHVLGQAPDFGYTQAPYPQFFSYWLASIYHAQGQTVAQFLPRLMTVVPLLLLLLVPIDLATRTTGRARQISVIVLYLCMVGATINNMHWAYADPLMTATLATGLGVLLQYLQRPSLRTTLLAGSCFVIAAVTKQPGILWAVICFPLLTAWGVYRLAWPRETLWIALIVAICGLVWPLAIGDGFLQNQGVISRSIAERAPLQTFLASAKTYLVLRPEVGVLVAGAAVLAWRTPAMFVVWLISVVPMLSAWFVFGSYEIRLGMHVIAFNALIAMYLLGASVESSRQSSSLPRLMFAPNAMAFAALTTFLAFNAHINADRAANGQGSAFEKQFGTSSRTVFDELIAEGSVIMTTSNYQYGLFFGRVPVRHLRPNGHPTTTAEMQEWLLDSGAAHVITSGVWAFGTYDTHLGKLIDSCPSAFALRLQSKLDPKVRIYEVNSLKLKSECAS